MKVKLQIYVLCRDRPEYAIKSIESVIKSADANTEVIISDNSETDSVEKMCLERFSSIRYIRRPPPRTAQNHFKTILDEATSRYLVLFHDDDIMHPNYVTQMLSYLESNPRISAVGCNAEFIDKDGNATGKFFLRGLNMPLIILTGKQFILPYLVGNEKSNGIVPFPSYMYRRKYISNSFLNYEHGGKYSDVTFLLKILKRAAIVWHPETMMSYRSHGSNGSAIESVHNRLSLIRYLINYEEIDRKSSEMINFKFTYWLIWWRCTHKSFNFFIPNGRKELVVFRFLALKSIHFMMYEAHFRRAFIRKVGKLIKSWLIV